MTLTNQIRLMAKYNLSMNHNLYLATAKLPNNKLEEDKKAFFGSIIGTLNHILVGDIIWLKRFSMHPANYTTLELIRTIENPTSLAQILYTDLDTLFQKRTELDNLIINWCHEIVEENLSYRLQYKNTKGEPALREFGSLLFHFFNHQTHHRGQITTLLSQEDIDVGVTDLLMLIPNEIKRSG